jgi:hypothetical protein
MANLGHPGRWLRHKKDGTIYNYNDILVKNPAVEEVPEEIAFPEKHIPKKQQGRKAKLDLSTNIEVVDKAIPKEATTGHTVKSTGGKKK